jgi:hypothetical protein
MQPELYDRLYAHCKELDIPITVFVREAISKALPNDDQAPNEGYLIPYARAAANAGVQPDLIHAVAWWSLMANAKVDV